MTTAEHILQSMPPYPARVSPMDMIEATGRDANLVRVTMGRMVDRGELAQTGYGEYSLPDPQGGDDARPPDVTAAQTAPPANGHRTGAPEGSGYLVTFDGPDGAIVRLRVVLEQVGRPVSIGVATRAL